MTGAWPALSGTMGGIMLLIAMAIGLGKGNGILGVMEMGHAIKNIVSFILKNPAKSLVSFLGVAWIIFYLSYSIPQTIQWFTGTAPTSQLTLWILNLITVGLGTVLAIAFFAATLSNFPSDMSFERRLKQLFYQGPYAGKVLKIIAATLLLIGLVLGLVWLGFEKVPAIGSTITLIIQIVCVIAVLATVFRYIMGHPRLLSTIKDNILFKLLFTVIMVIPCLLVHLTEGMMATGKAASFHAKLNTIAPKKEVLIILAVEIILVSAYVVLPMFRKWIYTMNPGASGDIVITQRIDGAHSAIFAADKQLIAAVSVGGTPLSDVNWKTVYSEQLYLTDEEHTKALKGYLTGLGYKDGYSAFRDNKLISDVLGKPITLGAAVSFIQTKNRVESIMDDSLNVEHLKEKLDALEKQTGNEDTPFKSKILNNKPTYINKKTNIGLYENLKGTVTSKFNQGKIAPNVADDYNYNYGLSAWIFLMAQPPSFGVGYTKFTKVLDYAGKPTIWYNPEINTLKITVNVYKKGSKTPVNKTVYKTKTFPLQRWNNIVINYVGGTLDVFINKKLMASVTHVIPYMSSEGINIGDNTGISGTVANVTYFSSPIGTNKISLFYDNLVNKDPPVI
jgi:hypothetical protein